MKNKTSGQIQRLLGGMLLIVIAFILPLEVAGQESPTIQVCEGDPLGNTISHANQDCSHADRLISIGPFLRANLLKSVIKELVSSLGGEGVQYKVLFIGNSLTFFNGGIETHFKRLAASADPFMVIEAVRQAPPGETLRGHYENPQTLDQIRTGNWDVIILQGLSNEPITNPDQFATYARLLDAEIRDTHAEVFFFLTWAYKDMPAMTDLLTTAYVQIAQELERAVVPVGVAWHRVLGERPDLNLYQDDRHPSFAGTYLAACLFYAALLEKSPVGLPYTGNLTHETAIYLQQVAWDTVQAFSLVNR